jgi:hypothetical protein
MEYVISFSASQYSEKAFQFSRPTHLHNLSINIIYEFILILSDPQIINSCSFVVGIAKLTEKEPQRGFLGLLLPKLEFPL